MDEEEKLHEDYKVAEKVQKKLREKFPRDSVFRAIQPMGILDVVHIFRKCKKEEVAKQLILKNHK